MYAFVDRRVDGLGDSCRFFVWAMRGWMQSIKKGVCPPRALGRGFAGIGGLSALPDFHIAMALSVQDALEDIVLGPMDHSRIVEDEAVFMGMWRDISLGDVDNVQATLRLLVEEESVKLISQAMTATIAKMVAAGVDLSEFSTQVSEEVKPNHE